MFLVHNKISWLHHPFIKWTEAEIDGADERGFIGTKHGIDCYLTGRLPENTPSHPDDKG